MCLLDNARSPAIPPLPPAIPPLLPAIPPLPPAIPPLPPAINPSDFQHGVRAKRSCETRLITFWYEVVRNSNSGCQIDVIIMDFSKGFDVVPYNFLFLKLKYLGIYECALDLTKDFLANRRQRVVVDGEFSYHAPVCSGVP